MSSLTKITVEDRGVGGRGWYGTKLAALREVEGELLLEDAFSGEALVMIDAYRLVLGVTGRRGDTLKYYEGGTWIDFANRRGFDFVNWATLIRLGL